MRTGASSERSGSAGRSSWGRRLSPGSSSSGGGKSNSSASTPRGITRSVNVQSTTLSNSTRKSAISRPQHSAADLPNGRASIADLSEAEKIKVEQSI